MTTRLVRGGIALATLSALTLTACGGQNLNAQSASTTSASAVSATLDSALAAKVPATIKSAGVLNDGTDASYAPNEIIGADGKTMEGMDIDLLNAVATTLGLKVNYTNANFDTIILGVSSGRYDIAVSSFTITKAREAQVNMVQYYSAGTTWAALSGNPKNVDPANACGMNVAVQKGTVEVDDLAAKNKACVAAGKKAITQIVEVQQTKVTADIISGKADAMLADSPVTGYAVKQAAGKLQAIGTNYDTAPYGIVVQKGATDLANLVAETLTELKKDGVYDSILAKWGISVGAVSSFPVNP